MNITLISTSEINNGVRHHCTLAEAAGKLGVSVSTIRRAAKRAGVRKIAGRTVCGGILIDRHPVPVVITYSAGVKGGAL